MGEKHFNTLSKEELRELSRKGGSHKNPRKGVGSLKKRERVRRAKEAANARWHKTPLERTKVEYEHTESKMPKTVGDIQ